MSIHVSVHNATIHKSIGLMLQAVVGVNLVFGWLDGSSSFEGYWPRNTFDIDGQPSFRTAPASHGCAAVYLRFCSALRRWVVTATITSNGVP